MRFKIDEDRPKSVATLCRERGFDATTVAEQGMGGSKDSALWSAIQAEQRFFITADKGFGDIRAFPPGTHAGLLLVRPDQDGIEPVLELLRAVVDRYDLTELAACLVVATPRGVRVRRPRRG